MISISKLKIHVLTCMALAAASYNATAATPTPLPPAVEEALNKGIIAAKVPDYLLAIRYFEEARKLAPQAPVVYLNLGLAESKIPGRELRAIAWFGAYLAAYPDAPNGAAVKEQIAVLDVRNQSNVSRLIKSVQDAANQLPPPSYIKEHALRDKVVELWAKAGDIQAALNITDLLDDDDDKSYARYVVSKIQAEDGDIAGAQKTANLIRGAALKSRAQSAIADVHSKSGITNAPNSTRHSTSDTQRPTQPVIPVSKWLLELGTDDKGNMYSDRYLNAAPFLDLASHLKSLNTSLKSRVARDNLQLEIFRKSEAQLIFDGLHETAKTIVEAQNDIAGMLKQQATR